MPYLIFDTEPVTWQELEDMVCQAFVEMGYESSRNHEILTARGKVRIDVHVVKPSNPIPTLVLCECKHWNKPVDQNIILGFRSICSDVGAHYGLIISKKGFQSGAMESRKYTNIHLLNFSTFQATFFNEWRAGIFTTLTRMCDLLRPLVLGNLNFDDAAVLNAKAALDGKLHGIQVFIKYEVFFGSRAGYTKFFIERGTFPAKITDPRGDPRILDDIVVRSPREYFDIAKKGCEDARRYFGI